MEEDTEKAVSINKKFHTIKYKILHMKQLLSKTSVTLSEKGWKILRSYTFFRELPDIILRQKGPQPKGLRILSKTKERKLDQWLIFLLPHQNIK